MSECLPGTKCDFRNVTYTRCVRFIPLKIFNAIPHFTSRFGTPLTFKLRCSSQLCSQFRRVHVHSTPACNFSTTFCSIDKWGSHRHASGERTSSVLQKVLEQQGQFLCFCGTLKTIEFEIKRWDDWSQFLHLFPGIWFNNLQHITFCIKPPNF